MRCQPRNEASRAEDSGGRKSRVCGHSEDSPGAQQQFDDTARFWTQAGEFFLRKQFSRANPGQHRQSIGALWIIEYACHFAVALFDDLEDIEVALVGALGAVVCHAHDLGKHAFAVAFERERVHAPQYLPVGFRNGAWHGADSIMVEAERERPAAAASFHSPRRQLRKSDRRHCGEIPLH